ncbi:MAG TPA: response regulator [Acidobacteriaceae bacterium]|jgi:ActR/RegA family two-component response regulator
MQRRLLLVDDESVIRITLSAILAKYGFEVSAAASVAEALQKITSETFDVLLSDLNIGNPGDGLTVVSAMRRTQPEAVTMILTGYPAFETALEAIRQQVDDYIVKPANIPALVNTIESKLATPPQKRQLPPPKRVAMILQEHQERIEELWLSTVEKDAALSRVALDKKQRLSYLKYILEEVIRAAQTYSGEEITGRRISLGGYIGQRDLEGYTPSLMLAEFCMLRRVVAQVIQENLLAVNLSYLVPDIARVNESLDEQAQAALARLSEHIDG